MGLNVHHVLMENIVAVKISNTNALNLRRGLLALVSPVALAMMMATSAQAQQRTIENPGVEDGPQFPSPGGFYIRPDSSTAGWESTNGELEVWATGHSGQASSSGSYHFELNPFDPIGLYQEVCLTNGETLSWSFDHAARNIGADPQTVLYEVVSTDGATTHQVLQTSSLPRPASNVGNAWTTRSGSTTYSGPSGIQRLQFRSTNAGSTGNFLDNISIDLVPYVELAAPSYSDAEASGGNIPNLLITGNVGAPFDVTVNITGGTATAGSDYTLNTSTVTIPAGVYDGGAASLFPIDLTIIEDSNIEPDETIEFSFTLPIAASAGNGNCNTPNSTAIYTILNDDVPPAPDADSGSGISGTASTPVSDVTDGDTVNGSPAVLGSGGNATISEVGTWPSGFTLDPDTGAVEMEGFVGPGTYTMDYQLCDTNSPANCETATITIVVGAEADFSITKTNTPGVNGEVDQTDDTVTSGQTTTFTLVATNNGPSTVTGAVVTDTPGAGLTCTGTDTVTLTGDGVPTGSFTIADLTGGGITLDTLADGQSTTLSYSCEVN